jgi:hypothetical protein
MVTRQSCRINFPNGYGGNYVPYMRGGKAALYMDEVPMDASMINSTPVSNIAMVKVIKGSGLIGNAVAIYPKRRHQPATPAVKTFYGQYCNYFRL